MGEGRVILMTPLPLGSFSKIGFLKYRRYNSAGVLAPRLRRLRRYRDLRVGSGRVVLRRLQVG